jgi:hypothetical protein
VRVFDGYAWSNWSPDAWFIINRPPVPDFDWSPKPVWEGDTVTLHNLSSDPDSDSLTFSWEIRPPAEPQVSFTSKDAAMRFRSAGDYSVTLHASDGMETRSVTKTIRAQELSIMANVLHTPQWLSIHEDKGHNTTAAPKDFYSGEVFVVQADSSPAPVHEVVAWIDTIGLDERPLYVSTVLAVEGLPTHFGGRLFDDRFLSATEGIPEGIVHIHFEIRYANGVAKRQSIPVNIIGNAHEAVSIHRRQ